MTDFHLMTPLQRWALVPFESDAELVNAMRSPEYSNPQNPAFRRAVEQKIALGTSEGSGVRVSLKTKGYQIKMPTVQPGEQMLPDVEREQGLAELQAEAAEQEAKRAAQPQVPPTYIPTHTV